MDVFGIETRTARKDGKCDMCRGAIRKGEKYERWAYADGGRASSIKVHTHCKALLNDCLDGDTEFTWDGVEDWLRDMCMYYSLCPDDTPLSEMAVLFDNHRRKASGQDA